MLPLDCCCGGAVLTDEPVLAAGVGAAGFGAVESPGRLRIVALLCIPAFLSVIPRPAVMGAGVGVDAGAGVALAAGAGAGVGVGAALVAASDPGSGVLDAAVVGVGAAVYVPPGSLLSGFAVALGVALGAAALGAALGVALGVADEEGPTDRVL